MDRARSRKRSMMLMREMRLDRWFEAGIYLGLAYD